MSEHHVRPRTPLILPIPDAGRLAVDDPRAILLMLVFAEVAPTVAEPAVLDPLVTPRPRPLTLLDGFNDFAADSFRRRSSSSSLICSKLEFSRLEPSAMLRLM